MKHLKQLFIFALFTILGTGLLWATETAATMTAGTNGSACTVNGADGIKVGTSSKGGDMKVTVPSGTTALHVYAAAWKGVSNLSLNISGATTNPTSIALTADDGISNNSPFTLSGNASNFKFDITLSNISAETTITFTSSAAKRFVVWGATYETSSGGTPQPTVSVTQSLEAFAYETGEPVAQSFSVSGSNLEDDVIVTAPNNFEVCATENGTYSSSITLTPTDGALAATTVYARLAENLAAGNYSGGNIIVSSEGATEQTVAVSGSVPYTINWYANNTTTPFATTYVAVGNTLALPATAPVPNNCGCTGLAFYGWYGEGNSYSNESTAPAIAAAGDAVSADKNYYAVFAEAEDLSTPGSFTSTFTDKSWSDGNSRWTKGADGNALTSDRGIQVTTGASGANATTASSYSNVSSVVVTYSTNASSGAGSIAIKVGNTDYTGDASVSSTGGTTDRTITYTGATNASGAVKITVTCSTNSIYIKSVQVNYSTGGITYSNYATTCCSKYDVNLENSGTVTGKGTFSASPISACEDATVTLSATPETGYELDKWSVAKAQGTVTVTDNQFTMPGEAVTVSATFKAKKHNVIFHKNFGEGDVTTSQEYTFAAAANLKSIETIDWTREGFTFSGWNTLSTGLGDSYADQAAFTLSVDADVNLYAQWVENTAHSVSYSGDAHIASYSTKPGSVQEDATALAVAFTLEEGYQITAVSATISGVAVAANNITYTQSSVSIASEGFAGDVAITFTIEEIKYTVSLNAGTGSVSTEGWTLNEGVYTQAQASYNANIQLPSANPSAACAEDYGWTFAGWATAAVSSETAIAPQTLLTAESNYKPESDVTLYAVYKRSQAGEGTTPKTASVTISDYATANNWANETKYSSVTIDEYITASASTSGNNGKYYTNGTNWRLYRGDNGTLTISTASNCTLTSATITFTVDKNGTLSGEGEDGDVTSETAYNISGASYTFTVGGGETGKTNGQVRVTAISVTYNKPADATIYYHSTPTCAAKYNVTIAEGIQNGTIEANVAKAVEGETVTLTATPAEHYHLDAWTVSKAQGTVTVTDNQFTMPGEAVTVSATFAINHHNVVFHKNAGDNPEVTATQDFAYGEQKALTANAFSRNNYNFGGWMTDANGTEANYADGASYTLNADADVNLYALWVPDNTRTITYTENEHIASYTAQATSVINTADNFTATFALVEGYKVTGVAVTMGGVALESGVSFTQTSLTVTKPEGGFTGNLVVTFTIEEIKYTVTLNAGSGTCETESMTQASLNATVALPSASPSEICASSEYGWTFAGWATEAVSQETTTAPTLLTGNYQPEGDVMLYAVYQRSENGETPETKYLSAALSDLTSSDVFVIVGNNGSNYAMSNDKGTSNPPAATAVTIDGNKITGEVADALKWNITGNATDGYTFYPNGSTTKWLYCTNDNNGVRVGNNEAKTFVVNEGYLKHSGTSRYVGVYNSSDWRCYDNTTGNIANQTFAFYKATAVYPTTTYYLSSPNCCQKYTITVDGEIANGSVAVTPNVAKACAETPLTLTATENENASRFKQWAVAGATLTDAQKTTNPLEIAMPASNLTVSATFDAIYAITKDEQNGTLTLGAEYAAEGDEVAISGVPVNAQYENPVITVFKTGDENTKVTVSNGKFTMPGYAVTARIVCTPALAAMEAPELGDPTDATYQGITLHWTGVTGNEGYVLTVYKDEVAVEGLVNVAIAKDATSYTITTGLAANTAYTYSIYTRGNGTSTLEVNTPNSGNFSTGDYPAATLSLKEGSNEAYAFGSDLKVNSTINLPTELAGSGCQEDVVLVGWTDNAEFANTDAEPTEHYWAAGAQYTVATTADQLYAVFATQIGGGSNDVAFNAETYASANNWEDSKAYTEFVIDGITFTAIGNGNNGKYYTSDKTWRFYNGGSLAISGTNITSVSSNPNVSFNGSNGTYSASFSETTKIKSITVRVSSPAIYSGYTISCTTAVPELAAPTFSLSEEVELVDGKYQAPISVVITNNASEGTLYYTIDGTDPTNLSEEYDGAISLSECGTTTIKAKVISSTNQSAVVSATYKINMSVANTAAAAYTPAEAIAIYDGDCGDKLTATVYVKGVVTSINTLNLTYGNYDAVVKTIDAEGSGIFTFYHMYKASGNTKFTASDDVIVTGDTLVAAGTLTKFGDTYELASGCYLVERKAFTVEKVDISNTKETAYTVARAIELIDDVTSDLTKTVFVKGVVTSISGSNIFIKDANAENEFEFYGCSGVTGVGVNDTIIGTGTMMKHNSTYELNSGCSVVEIKKYVAHVTSVTLNETEKTLVVEETFQLTATIEPEEADNKNVTWTSSNTNAVTIDEDGLVTAVASGISTITVRTVDGNKTATCVITVTEESEQTEAGSITFGSGKVEIDATTDSGTDVYGNTWNISISGNSPYFSQNADYSQVGSSNKPATSITFTTTLPASVQITKFAAKFGGFSSTAGAISLKVGDETVATGNLNGTDDVIVSSTPNINGTVLTVTVTNISKGVKAYYISYEFKTVISGDANLSDQTYNNTTEFVVPAGATLTVNETATIGAVTVEKDGEVVVDNQMTAESIVVEDGGKVTLNENVNADVFQIAASKTANEGNSSGQVIIDVNNAKNLRVTGEAYFDYTLDPSGTASYGHYAFCVPFPVNSSTGIYTTSNVKLYDGIDYVLYSYHGDIRATGNYGWKRFNGTLTPGVFYLISLYADENNVCAHNTIRFKMEAQPGGYNCNGADATVDFSKYEASEGVDASNSGWNGVGNPTVQYVKSKSSSYYNSKMYVYNHGNNAFGFVTAGTHTFTVGSPFFIQAGATASMSFDDGSAATENILAPARVNGLEVESISVSFGNETYKDQLFVSASEDALNSYQITKDLAKMSMGTAKVAQISSSNYGVQLAVEYAPLVNDQASYQLNLYAPAAGAYSISAQQVEGATLYVTYNGAIVWNLSLGDYEMDLVRGTTTGYGLLLVAQPNQMPTGVENGELLNGENGVQKILLNGQLYILRDGHLYDAVGKEMK